MKNIQNSHFFSAQCIQQVEKDMIESNIKWRYMTAHDLDLVYDLLYRKESVYDEFLELQILPENCWSKDDICEYLKQKKTRGIVIERLTPFQEKHNDKIEWFDIFCGFILYEVTETTYQIDYLLGEDQQSYEKLIDAIINKAENSIKIQNITINVEETNNYLMKILFSLKFKSKLIRKPQKDYYQFELIIKK